MKKKIMTTNSDTDTRNLLIVDYKKTDPDLIIEDGQWLCTRIDDISEVSTVIEWFNSVQSLNINVFILPKVVLISKKSAPLADIARIRYRLSEHGVQLETD